MKLHNRSELRSRRRALRNPATPAESTLWLLLKGKQLDGRKFRRQHSIGPYILDFYCPSEKLAIELDGEQHFMEEGIRRDERRTNYLRDVGITVLRFENFNVFDHPEMIVREIRRNFGRREG